MEEVDELEDLVKELETANEEIKEVTADEEVKEEPSEVDRKGSELVRLSEDGDIDQFVKYIKKASA